MILPEDIPATTHMPKIHFKVTIQTSGELEKLGSPALITLPKSASGQLPSRGMVMVDGVLSGQRVRVLLQPDGQGSHWFTLGKDVLTAAKVHAGDSLDAHIEPIKVWPEPVVPNEVQQALASDAGANETWTKITPMARWDWLNWMDAVKLAETRKERPDKLCSMLRAGKRRPCCFNRSARMAPKNAVLL